MTVSVMEQPSNGVIANWFTWKDNPTGKWLMLLSGDHSDISETLLLPPDFTFLFEQMSNTVKHLLLIFYHWTIHHNINSRLW